MSKSPTPILIIDDDPDVVTAARLLLKQAYIDVHTENDPYRLNTLLKQQQFDVVISSIEKIHRSQNRKGRLVSIFTQ